MRTTGAISAPTKSLLGPSLLLFCWSCASAGAEMTVTPTLDRISQNIHIAYRVPAGTPEEVHVRCTFALQDSDEWKPAAVNKLRSPTASYILRKTDIFKEEADSGTVTELFSAARTRTLVWEAATQLPAGRKTDLKLKLEVLKGDIVLAQKQIAYTVDLTNVLMLSKFAGNKDIYPAIVAQGNRDNPGWYQSALGLESYESDAPLEPLAWAHRLAGYYAMYVAVPKNPDSTVNLRLSSDMYAQRFSGFDGREQFWKIARLDNTNLVISQSHRVTYKINDATRSRLRYLRLVKVSKGDHDTLYRSRTVKRDKLVFGYFEPYSWAFNEYVGNNYKFAEALAAYADARVDHVDMQVGRHGARPLYASYLDSPLYGLTHGDSNPKTGAAPKSLDTGRMVRLADAIKAGTFFAKAWGMRSAVNFGAGITYHGGPLEGAFAKENRDLTNGKYFLSLKHEKVVKHLLAMFREALTMGGENLSIDFNRYPFVAKTPDEVFHFLTKTRKLTDELSSPERKIEILVRFPIPGSKGEEGNYRPADWVAAQLVDYLVPKDHGGHDPYFDIKRYVAMVKGTTVKLLPCIEGGNGSMAFPGEQLRRVAQLYRDGADGIYIYQSDANIVATMNGPLCNQKDLIRVFGSSKLVNEALAEMERRDDSYSTEALLYHSQPYQSCRAVLWIEGLRTSKVSLHHKGRDEALGSYTTPPYVLGRGGHKNHYQFLGPNQKITATMRYGEKIWTKEFNLEYVHRSYSF
ncbi:MAG: hypothetical protein KAI66_09435 [Lentisphaeria bacterium]|nr:hypothetical protein [Lentisphaeria bacterium]